MRPIKILCIVFSQSAFKMCTSCVQFYQWQKPFTTVLSNETPKNGDVHSSFKHNWINSR